MLLRVNFSFLRFFRLSTAKDYEYVRASDFDGTGWPSHSFLDESGEECEGSLSTEMVPSSSLKTSDHVAAY